VEIIERAVEDQSAKQAGICAAIRLRGRIGVRRASMMRGVIGE
jgi:hypothetical protein